MSDNYRLNYRGLQTYDRLLKQYLDERLQPFQGATKYHNGTQGLVPAPIIGDQKKYLKGDGTWSEVPSFITLYDTNYEEIILTQDETEIAFIECILKKKVDLEGHLTMSLYSTEDCHLYLRIKDNLIEEVYMPQTYILHQGYNTIDLPHAYLGKIADTHYLTVTAQCSNGSIVIPTRGLLYTVFGAIDDSYENIGIDIVDIAVQSVNHIPSKIYALSYDENHLFLRENEFNNPNENVWLDIHDFGTALGGAIEFYGTWEDDYYHDKYQLNTEEHPHVFIIDESKNLFVYSNNNYDNGTLLANNVDKVSAVIGYKSNRDINLDQGLIVAYLANGNAYYRQWKYYDDNSNMWFGEETIYDGGDAVNISVHRLPDYRVGFLVQTDELTKWYISDRTYVGNTGKYERARVTGTGNHMLVGIVPAERVSETLGVATMNEFEVSHYYNDFILTFEGELRFLFNTTATDFARNVVVKRNNVVINTNRIDVDGNQITVHTVSPVQGGCSLNISWTTDNMITTNRNGSDMQIRQKSYTWALDTTHVVGAVSDEESISASVNSVGISVRPIGEISNALNDDAAIQSEGSPNIFIHPIAYTQNNIREISTTVQGQGDINMTVVQVGELPI